MATQGWKGRDTKGGHTAIYDKYGKNKKTERKTDVSNTDRVKIKNNEWLQKNSTECRQ